MKEIWKDIPGYEGLYQASNLGRIKSLLFNKEKIFIGSVDAEKELKQKGIKVNASNIRNVCNGKRNNAGGYKWCYVEE